MPLMNLSQVRVVDPVLSKIVQGYGKPEFVGNFLFPNVPVRTRAGKIIEFGREDFALFNVQRSPGAAMRRRNIAYSSRSYTLMQSAIEGELPIEHLEEAEGAELPINLQAEAAEGAMYTIMLNLENKQADIALNAANYAGTHTVTLAGTDQWSDPTSDPRAQILTWKETVRSAIGIYPNTMVMGSKVFNAAAAHPTFRDQIKYVSSESITPDLLASFFDLSRGVKVGTSLKLNETTGSLEDIWGDQLVLAYVPEEINTRRTPSYGYTYHLEGYPLVEDPYYERNHRTWYFPVVDEHDPAVTSLSAGFLALDVSGT